MEKRERKRRRGSSVKLWRDGGKCMMCDQGDAADRLEKRITVASRRLSYHCHVSGTRITGLSSNYRQRGKFVSLQDMQSRPRLSMPSVYRVVYFGRWKHGYSSLVELAIVDSSCLPVEASRVRYDGMRFS